MRVFPVHPLTGDLSTISLTTSLLLVGQVKGAFPCTREAEVHRPWLPTLTYQITFNPSWICLEVVAVWFNAVGRELPSKSNTELF